MHRWYYYNYKRNLWQCCVWSLNILVHVPSLSIHYTVKLFSCVFHANGVAAQWCDHHKESLSPRQIGFLLRLLVILKNHKWRHGFCSVVILNFLLHVHIHLKGIEYRLVSPTFIRLYDLSFLYFKGAICCALIGERTCSTQTKIFYF